VTDGSAQHVSTSKISGNRLGCDVHQLAMAIKYCNLPQIPILKSRSDFSRSGNTVRTKSIPY